MMDDVQILIAKRTILALPTDEKFEFAIEILEDAQREADEMRQELIECKERIEAERKINRANDKYTGTVLEDDFYEQLWKAYSKQSKT